MSVPESTRIEIINLQAGAAADLGELELSCQYIEAGANAAKAQGYNLWSSEAAKIFHEKIQPIWFNEPKVKALTESFQK